MHNCGCFISNENDNIFSVLNKVEIINIKFIYLNKNNILAT